MSILAGYMVPHPPLIIHKVGHGKEEAIRATINAYERVAEEIAETKPDTIFISTPHSVMYADYFHISPGRYAVGDMADFGAPDVRVEVEYDTALVEELCRRTAEISFPAGILGEQKATLDHATLIPLCFVQKRYRDFRVVRIGLSGLPLAAHYRLGILLRDAAEALGRRAVYIASGDLSHKMKQDGPYGFAEEGVQYDQRLMDVMGRGSFGELFDFEETFCAQAAECGHRSFVMMAGAFDGMDVDAAKLVHEAPFGVGYGVCTFHPTVQDEARRFLMRRRQAALETCRAFHQEDAFVAAARRAIAVYVASGEQISVEEALEGIEDAETRQLLVSSRAGAFVSLHKDGALRGCIGTIHPVCACSAEEIIRNAISACSADPRFSPISQEELPHLTYSVDVLGEPQEITSPAQLDVKRYGVIVENNARRGVLLPDLEGVETVEQQIAIAKEKAGIMPQEEVRMQRFTVTRHT